MDSLKRTSVLSVIVLIGGILYLIGLKYYPHQIFFTISPLLLLSLAGINFYRGEKKLRKAENHERGVVWYKQYNIIFAFFWLSWFAVFPIYYFVPEQKHGVFENIILILLVIIIIILFLYTFFLYRNDKRIQ